MPRERVLVTGSAGHLGEALVRVLRSEGRDVVGVDLLESPHTNVVASVADRAVIRRCLAGVDGVLHSASLHKPHLRMHDRHEFLSTNVSGTLTLLEEAARAGVGSFVFTSSTSAFGRALSPPPAAPAAWVTEQVASIPRNMYGVSKKAAEDLCELAHMELDLPVVVLRTSRFFPEQDDRDDVRAAYAEANVKANEYLHRRVDIQDVADAHLLAMARAPAIGFAKYVISSTTPFTAGDRGELRADAPRVVRRHFPDQEEEYRRRGWKVPPSIDRVYVNARARTELSWDPTYDYRYVLDRLKEGEDPRSPLARAVGAKGYGESER